VNRWFSRGEWLVGAEKLHMEALLRIEDGILLELRCMEVEGVVGGEEVGARKVQHETFNSLLLHVIYPSVGELFRAPRV
jgi:hypothetical protein